MQGEGRTTVAKNTMFLYGRVLLILFVGLFTSRVVLQALGVVDWGIYSLVGGVVSMLQIFTNSLRKAIVRFITYAIGKGDKEDQKKVFATSLTLLAVMSIFLFLIVETAGLWFVNHKIVVPPDRLFAANCVLHLSSLSFVISVMAVPYNAIIMAYERMSVYAYLGILEALLRLSVAVAVCFSPTDTLIFYAALLCFNTFLMQGLYVRYCRKHFEESAFRLLWNADCIKRMFAFAGWTYLSSASMVIRNSFIDILINLFFGPAVNAGRGIATQIEGAVTNFSTNFMAALTPQITKSYAVSEKEYAMSLVYQGSKFSYFLLLFLSLPIMASTEYILSIWLYEVPPYAAVFVQLILLFTLSETLSDPLTTVMFANGNIRNFQLTVGACQLLNPIISYLLLRMGGIPEVVFIVQIVISQICLAARLFFLKQLEGVSPLLFFHRVYTPVLLVSLFSGIPTFFLSKLMPNGILSFLAISVLAVILTIFSVYFLGCTSKERVFLVDKLKKMKKKL